MSWLTLHLAGGGAFFSGTTILVLVLAAAFVRHAGVRVGAWVAVVVGVMAVAPSSTPLPSWAYVIWLGAVLAATLGASLRGPSRATVAFAAAVGAICVGVMIAEGRHRGMRNLPVAPSRTLYVIGDSLSAGFGDERVWPRLLQTEHDVDVVNLSRGGATVGSILLDLDHHPPLGDGVVLLEIGGNDQFGRTPTPEFETNLDALVRRVSGPGKVLVMFELPLLPLNNAFGEIQRRLAARHGVVLIPKRHLVKVVAPRDATSDGIHLTPSGHRRMAEVVWELLGRAFPPASTTHPTRSTVSAN